LAGCLKLVLEVFFLLLIITGVIVMIGGMIIVVSGGGEDYLVLSGIGLLTTISSSIVFVYVRKWTHTQR